MINLLKDKIEIVNTSYRFQTQLKSDTKNFLKCDNIYVKADKCKKSSYIEHEKWGISVVMVTQGIVQPTINTIRHYFVHLKKSNPCISKIFAHKQTHIHSLTYMCVYAVHGKTPTNSNE